MKNNQQILGTEPIGKLLTKIFCSSNNRNDSKCIIQCSR